VSYNEGAIEAARADEERRAQAAETMRAAKLASAQGTIRSAKRAIKTWFEDVGIDNPPLVDAGNYWESGSGLRHDERVTLGWKYEGHKYYGSYETIYQQYTDAPSDIESTLKVLGFRSFACSAVVAG
jgi:hypothetical protein